jgi:NAD-dependent SIR2 family protein deacetylase
MNEALIKQAAYYVKSADALLITAGAGMGVDSGLPDFRGSEGFWRAYPVARKMGYKFEDMAQPRLFDLNPSLAWGFYGHRLNLYRKTIPHKGFEILLKWIRQKGDENYFVYTSNVDGQFQKAGFDEDRIVECHGSIHYLQCTLGYDEYDLQPGDTVKLSEPCHGIWSAKDLEINVHEESLTAVGKLPLCKECSKLARPNIMMFGDSFFDYHRTDMQKNRFANWAKQMLDSNKKIVVLEFGAGTSIPTIRMLSEKFAKKYNAHLIRINPIESHVFTKHEIVLPMSAYEAIYKIELVNKT